MKNLSHEHYIEIKHDVYVPWGIFDVIFSYIFIFILSIIFAGSLLYAGLDVNMVLFSIILQILLSFSALIVIYLIVTKKYDISFARAFGLSFENLRPSLNTGIFVTAIIIITTTFISMVFYFFTGIEPRNPYIEMTEQKLKWLTILAIFLAPIVEEIFFRGFMQPAISKLTGPFLGIIITALIFGASHTQYIDYSAAIFSVTAIGLILGITKYYTGSVMPGIFAHLFNNVLAILYIVT